MFLPGQPGSNLGCTRCIFESRSCAKIPLDMHRYTYRKRLEAHWCPATFSAPVKFHPLSQRSRTAGTLPSLDAVCTDHCKKNRHTWIACMRHSCSHFSSNLHHIATGKRGLVLRPTSGLAFPLEHLQARPVPGNGCSAGHSHMRHRDLAIVLCMTAEIGPLGKGDAHIFDSP